MERALARSRDRFSETRSANRRRIRLMIVDDSTVARAVLSRMVETDPSFEITAVAGSAEDDLRLVAVAALTEELEEFHPAHHWHVPVEQDDVGHARLTARQGFLAVAGLVDTEFQRFEDVPRDLPDHLGVVDDQTALHAWFPDSVRLLIKMQR